MEKRVLLKFKGNNSYDVNLADKVEFMTNGALIEKNGKYYLKYTETFDYNRAANTTLKIEDDKVTVIRYGETNSQMIMETGKKHMSYYETQFGAVLVGVTADRMCVDMGNGKIKIDYDVEINNQPTSRNSINITFEEIGGEA